MQNTASATKVYDMIVIGGGPAGYTAALYAARAALSVLILEKLTPGGQMALTAQIDNYPGFDEDVYKRQRLDGLKFQRMLRSRPRLTSSKLSSCGLACAEISSRQVPRKFAEKIFASARGE